jgi:hypothetical protein
MRQALRIRPLPALACGLLLALAGCGGDIARNFGLQRDTPDEFQVTTRAPLAMPPAYMLTPPQPGASRPQEVTPRAAAVGVLAPQAALQAPAGSSAGQQALIQAAGPAAPADIRATVNALSAIDSPRPGFTESLMFWRLPAEPGVIVNPTAEAQRLRENAALGQSNQDGTTTIIMPKSKNIFGF